MKKIFGGRITHKANLRISKEELKEARRTRFNPTFA